jgi:hypothetical protein
MQINKYSYRYAWIYSQKFNKGNNAHFTLTHGTCDRMDFIYFLNQAHLVFYGIL